jgi:hypothetical protein
MLAAGLINIAIPERLLARRINFFDDALFGCSLEYAA